MSIFVEIFNLYFERDEYDVDEYGSVDNYAVAQIRHVTDMKLIRVWTEHFAYLFDSRILGRRCEKTKKQNSVHVDETNDAVR